MPVIIMPRSDDGHLHYFLPLFVMVGTCLAFRFTVNGYAKSAAKGKIIEGTVIDKGQNFIKYSYTDSSGKQCEKKSTFTDRAKADEYQLSQRIPLISTTDPVYLSGKKTEYVVTKESFDRSYEYNKKVLWYCQWVTVISVIGVLILSHYGNIEF